MGKFSVVLAFVCLFGIAAFANTNDAPIGYGKRVLAILENSNIKASHSIFFKSLEGEGFKIDYVQASDSVDFQKYGEWQYDNLIIFAPNAEELAGVTPQTLLEFVDAGHNVLVAASSKISEAIREIASECNIEFEAKGTSVIDHLNFDTSDVDGAHTLIVADKILDAPVIFSKPVNAPVLFKGIGQDIQEDSPLLFSLLTASSTAYSHSVNKPINEISIAGRKISLVSALQARNNARVTFSGSLELFSDAFFNLPVQKYAADGSSKKFEKSGNEAFAKNVAEWTFQERGVLRASNVRHHRVNETDAPAMYTINEDIEYSIQIEQWNGKRWVPFSAKDVQLEFRMIDPYVRINLKADDKGMFSQTFKIPDVYGVFTFKIEYFRKGYGSFTSITRTPVRPYRHTQYERFIDAAYPYYASAFSMMAGLFVFSWVFLYNREK
jgi:oligosaccharyltransferase complex subunit beta